MQRLTRREIIKLAVVAGLATLFGSLASGIDPEEKIEKLEQPTEEPTPVVVGIDPARVSDFYTRWYAYQSGLPDHRFIYLDTDEIGVHHD